MTHNTPGVTKEYFNNKVIIALLTIIQGGPSYNDRYFSLNMLNLLSNGIGTFEFRIKQGSNDVEENKMFMLLLAEFVKSIMNIPESLTSNIYKNSPIKNELWKIHNILITNKWIEKTEMMFENIPPLQPLQQDKKHTVGHFQKLKKSIQSLYTQQTNTELVLHKTTREIVTSLFKALFTLIEDVHIRNYWKNIASKLYHIDFSGTRMHSHQEPIVETIVNIEGGRDSVISALQEKYSEIPNITIAKQQKPYKKNTHFYSKLKTAFEEKHKKQHYEKTIVNTSFGKVDYNEINKTMIENGCKEFYKAYLKDTKIKLRPKSV
jgi:hypothetical protein